MKYLIALLVACGPAYVDQLPPESPKQTSDVLDAIVGITNAEGSAFCAGAFWREYVVTAYHCVDDLDTVNVGLYRDVKGLRFAKTYLFIVARVISAEDLALLSPIEVLPEHVSLIPAPEAPEVGREVVAIGHPFGLPYSVTRGHVAHALREGRVSKPKRWVQVTARISPGNSGGPLLNRYGELVGVASFVFSSFGDSVNGFVHLTAIKELLGE